MQPQRKVQRDRKPSKAAIISLSPYKKELEEQMRKTEESVKRDQVKRTLGVTKIHSVGKFKAQSEKKAGKEGTSSDEISDYSQRSYSDDDRSPD